jgi:Flp pilus assembly pilin Flp
MKTPVIKERGQGAVEYALLIAIIAFMVIAMLALVHDRAIQSSIARVLTSPDPLGENVQQNPPDPGTNSTLNIIDAAAPAAAIILLIYAFAHLKGPAKPVYKAKPAKRK